VGNDADVAGYGAIKGDGVELVLTLGTGLGGALFTNGHLCPGLEIGHHIWRKKGMTYEDYLGRRGLDKFGKKEWNKLSPGSHQDHRSPLQLGPPLPGRRQHQEDRFHCRPRTSRLSPTKAACWAAFISGRTRPDWKEERPLSD
jgi:hypothetical protein